MQTKIKSTILFVFFALLFASTQAFAGVIYVPMLCKASADVTAPTMSSATIATNGTTLTLAYDENVTQGAGYNDSDIDLDCTVNGDNVSVTYSSGDGTNSHVYTIGATIYQSADETCTLDFNGDANSLEDDSGNDLASISNGAITNNSTQAAPTCDDSSCTGFDTCQNFEGTGYDNSETWTDDDGSINPDVTSSPGRGSQSCSLEWATESAHLIHSMTSRNSYYAHLLVKFSALASSGGATFFRFLGSDTDRLVLQIYETGEVLVFHGSSWSFTTDQMSINTWYHVFVYYALGTGSNGVAWVEWTAASTRSPSGSGNKYAEVTDGDSTGAVDSIAISETDGSILYVDQVLARASAITEVCE